MLLHVLNGDCTRMILERTSVPGELLVYPDVLHDGPVRADLSGDAWRRLRARHWNPDDPAAEERMREHMRQTDATLGRHAEFDEVVFWF